MKLLCALVVLCVTLNLAFADVQSAWKAYKAKYNKEYNAVEDAIHEAIWKHAMINQVEINDRSDWTQEQLDAALNPYIGGRSVIEIFIVSIAQ